MGMPAAARKEWTAEMARALPSDGNRYEVLDGELFVTPPPAFLHQRAISKLLAALSVYLEACPVGIALTAPGEVEYSTTRWVEPDVFVLPLIDGREPTSWADAGRPILVVEVLSPTTAHADRVRKRAIYQSERVPEYWIVDADARLIERWRPDSISPEIVTDTLSWQPDSASAPLLLDVQRCFAPVARDR